MLLLDHYRPILTDPHLLMSRTCKRPQERDMYRYRCGICNEVGQNPLLAVEVRVLNRRQVCGFRTGDGFVIEPQIS